VNRRIAQNIAELSPDTLFIGIDVGKKRHQVSIMTEKANIVAKFRIDNFREGFEYPLNQALYYKERLLFYQSLYSAQS